MRALNGMIIHRRFTLVAPARKRMLYGCLFLNYSIYSMYMHRVHWQDERMNK